MGDTLQKAGAQAKEQRKMFLDTLLGLDCIYPSVHCTMLTFIMFPSENIEGLLVSALTLTRLYILGKVLALRSSFEMLTLT